MIFHVGKDNSCEKSKIGSDRLQNFIFVPWELARDNAMKWSDPFRDSEKKKKVPRSAHRRVKIKVAKSSGLFHGKVTNQNDNTNVL